MTVAELIKQLEQSGDSDAEVVVGVETKYGGIEFIEIDFVTNSDYSSAMDENFPAIINLTAPNLLIISLR